MSPLYQIACEFCSFREEYYAVTFDSLLLYLKMKDCPKCAGKLKRLPSTSNFRIEDGTPKFYPNKGDK